MVLIGGNVVKKKLGIVLLVIVLLLAALGVGGYFVHRYLYQDMTGVPYSEIEAYKAENPYVNISYSVNIDGGTQPMILTHETTAVVVESINQTASLIDQAEYLQGVTEINLGSLALTADQLDAMKAAFPNAEVKHTTISILGTSYIISAPEVDLSMMTPDQLDTAISELKPMTGLKVINLITADGKTNLSVDDVLKLQSAYPSVQFDYAFDLFGKRVTTDMSSLEYARMYIGDAGLQQIRKVLPLMYNLTYLKLDDCKTSDEAMAQLRADFPNIEVHWRIFYSVFNCMTDNYKLWTIGGLMDKQIGPFDHLRGIKYLDLGHNYFTHLNFMKNLKDVEVAILAIGQLEDISGIKDCTNLTYLEIFSNRKLDNEDMQNLSGLVNMEYLNISNIPLMTDLSFTDNMPKLKKLWCTLSHVPQAEIDRVKALHPDCEFVFMSQGDPTDYGWRYHSNGKETARYALLKKQFDYDRDQVSQWPKGELKEEVTYESTGITPED